MIELYNIGISETTIKNMLEINQEIKELPQEKIKEKVVILNSINCDNNQIINIISSNPNYLTKTNEEIINLINFLMNYGLKCLNILFDSNPYILNLEPFEIEEYINNRKINGEKIEDIIDDLDSNPHLFNEI